MPRFHCADALHAGLLLSLPPGAARHVQVLRLQPGAAITLFDGRGGEYAAEVRRMGRSEVEVLVGAQAPVEREAPVAVHLGIGMPANERMDWLVEKAAELGVASLQPLLAERSVLRLAGERAQKKQAHWQGVAIAACEQCGRNRVPVVHPVLSVRDWLATARPGLLLSLAAGTRPLADLLPLLLAGEGPGATGNSAPSGSAPHPNPAPGGEREQERPAAQSALRPLPGEERGQPPAIHLLSGPEGGLTPAEEEAALARGWHAVHLGPRVLRAETAPLAALALLTLGHAP